MSDPTGFSEENDDKIRVDPVRLARKRYVLAEARRLLRERLGEPEWASANDGDTGKEASTAGNEEN
jgi:hypothetical protein